MKTVANIKKTQDNGDKAVACILFLWVSLVILGVIYGVHCNDSYELLKGHTGKSDATGEDFGTVIARAKEMDGHCEYRACDKTCDWYDNSNSECNNMNKGEWVAVHKNKIYQGTSLCSETKGEFAKIGNPSQKIGAYCWCKSGKNWVSNLFLINQSYCSDNGCAGNCAHSVLYSDKFRSIITENKMR